MRGKAANGEGKDGDRDKPKPKTGHGPTKQPELPIVEAVHESDEPDRTCPKCGGALVVVDGYAAYGRLRKDLLKESRDGPVFKPAFCWAYVRRKFVACEKADPRENIDTVSLPPV